MGSISLGADESYAETVSIKGVVVNESLQKASVETLPVTLYINGLDDRVDSLHTLTGPDGSFEFKSMTYDEDVLYGVTVEYKGVLYSSLIDVGLDNQPIITISVYENTEDSKVLFIDTASFVISEIDLANRVISILEMATIVNDSNFSYVPGDGPMDLIRFALPKGATNLILDTSLIGADYIQVDKGVALISSVPPGSHEVFYSYLVPYEGSEWSFHKTWRYGVNKLKVLVPVNIAKLRLGASDDVKQISLAGREYEVAEMSDITRESKSLVFLSDIEELSYRTKLETEFKNLDFRYVGPVGLFLILLASASWGILRTAKYRDRQNELFPGSSETQVVIDMISELELLKEKDLIDQETYAKRKVNLQKRLDFLNDD